MRGESWQQSGNAVSGKRRSMSDIDGFDAATFNCQIDLPSCPHSMQLDWQQSVNKPREDKVDL